MKSYISRKLPLETRITFLIFSLRPVPGDGAFVFMIAVSNQRRALEGDFRVYGISRYCQTRKNPGERRVAHSLSTVSTFNPGLGSIYGLEGLPRRGYRTQPRVLTLGT